MVIEQGKHGIKHLMEHPTGQIFTVAPSSRAGLLYVALSTGHRGFLGYVSNFRAALVLIEQKYGAWRDCPALQAYNLPR